MYDNMERFSNNLFERSNKMAEGSWLFMLWRLRCRSSQIKSILSS